MHAARHKYATNPFETTQVVAVLNPLAKEKLTGELQEEIAELQNCLHYAHDEVRLKLNTSSPPDPASEPQSLSQLCVESQGYQMDKQNWKAGGQVTTMPVSQMHVLERKLADTIGYLSVLERSSNSLQDALERSISSDSDAAGEQQQERERSSNGASTSQVGQTPGCDCTLSYIALWARCTTIRDELCLGSCVPPPEAVQLD
jgi:hypothetical protein